MNGLYSLYKCDADGIRDKLITEFSILTMDLIWASSSKITLSGTSIGKEPFSDGDRIVIYRNGYFFLGWIIEDVEIACDNPAVNIRKWKAAGRSESVMFSWRQVLPDPEEITFDSETMDRTEDTVYNRMLHYIYNCFGKGTALERRLYRLQLPTPQDIGETALSAYRCQGLDKALEELEKEADLVPVLTCDDKTGIYTVTIADPRDMTEDVIISPEYGNVVKWSRKETIPDFNAVWVVSGDYSQGRLYVYAEDEESIEKYGRIEHIVTRSDLKVYEPPEEESEETTEEEAIDDTEHLSEEDVLSLLEQEAQNQLRDHGRKVSWSIQAAETRQMAFMDDWQLGDKVTCVIDGERFESQITKVKITYKEGVETVEPTVGDVEHGLFGEIFKMLKGLDDRITNKENE